jgi:hypothetical protein
MRGRPLRNSILFFSPAHKIEGVLRAIAFLVLVFQSSPVKWASFAGAAAPQVAAWENLTPITTRAVDQKGL